MSVGTSIAHFNKAVDEVHSVFPDANIYVSGLLPKKGDKNASKHFNEKVQEINIYLNESYKDENHKAKFIGNTDLCKNSKKFYSQSDMSGIHLSKQGQDEVVGNIVTAISNSKNMKKRCRSPVGTPLSTEKDTKARKFVGETLDESITNE